uniref:Uncharacterized protein n=1 Tax=Siphoviridae sp. ctMOb8 TaxID=2825460 RepID=A0A8S5Q0V2_9CAUD|nr:MAG TPA: hypothetical protein [Siphoviridae sp. ctMOb8]DAM76517.1 MAG TPA: hypothetical protein [Caudoviricetes sp.]
MYLNLRFYVSKPTFLFTNSYIFVYFVCSNSLIFNSSNFP